MRSLRSLLLMLIIAGLVASGLLTAASMWGAARTTDAAQRALVAKDVTADILPPPLYLIELRLVLSEAVEGSMPLPTAQAEVTRLERDTQSALPIGLKSRHTGCRASCWANSMTPASASSPPRVR